ncbi:F1F0 ATP synthase assembly protein Atp10 [Seminavis robusta]|uniref:F1F0 ATP synthase assembly protein Atp10 n=1 Tax=Seminavis robusta TaxID=568900 RepID=A0A9N8DQT4_9STRA|nr:F1F0 ATP synthase assembly protein Atp10 [Seminavis robusta]|eukprot:Sro273_g105130.1 F1F0 ATP synthase assembly protein Atp10 (334) ;mRNA; f:36675-37879
MSSVFVRRFHRALPAAATAGSGRAVRSLCRQPPSFGVKLANNPLLAHTTRNFFDFAVKEDNRIREIIVNPDSLGSKIKPGNLIDKYNKRAKETRTVPVELEKGYFWMIKDLQETKGKPTLSNPHLIPAEKAQLFPRVLAGVSTLAGKDVEIPEFFLRRNRSRDEHAQCTLVALSCRDHGFQSLKTWTEPFQEAFQDNPRGEVVHLHITEGWFSASVLGSLITRMVRNNTPVEHHDNTLICLRKDLEDFRDALRIHNVMCGYIFLLDGIGKVRFAGSGEASEAEKVRLVQFAQDLTQVSGRRNKGLAKKLPSREADDGDESKSKRRKAKRRPDQ